MIGGLAKAGQSSNVESGIADPKTVRRLLRLLSRWEAMRGHERQVHIAAFLDCLADGLSFRARPTRAMLLWISRAIRYFPRSRPGGSLGSERESWQIPMLEFA